MSKKILSLLLFFFSIAAVRAQGFLRAEGKKIVDGKGEEVILRGVGLGGWMLQEPYMLRLSGLAYAQHDIRAKIKNIIGEKKTGQFYEQWLASHCTRRDMDSLAAWGFNSVRLPMHYNLFTLPIEEEPVPGSHTWLAKGFEMTDQLLQWCAANKIYLILDLHAAPGGNGSDSPISDRDTTKPNLWQSAANREKTIALWKKLAERYVNEPWIGGYDLVNEPNWGFSDSAGANGCNEKSNAPLRDLQVELTRVIRAIDQNHIIFIEGNCWGNNYEGIFPPWDDNLVMSFHKYWNYNTQESIQHYIALRDQYNIPIWLGETGENSNAWFTDLIQLVERNGIGWNMWPMKKSGINNLLEVPMPAGLHSIYEYWRGNAKKPKKKAAFRTLMEFAGNTHISKNIVRRDVIDAMVRQVKSREQMPFKSITLNPGSILYAVDYDAGHNGITYADNDSYEYWVSTSTRTGWNQGGQYRNDGVDIEASSDAGGNGYNIGWIEDGEWMEYSVYAPEPSKYNLEFRTASPGDEGMLELMVNGGEFPQSLKVPNSGGYQSWTSSDLKNVEFVKGMNRLRVRAQKGGFNFSYIKFHEVEVGTQ